MVAERGFPQALPFFFPLTIGAFGFAYRTVLWIVVMLHGLSATSVYYLDANQLRLQCATRNLSTEGGVRQLRQRLAEFVKSNVMGGVDTQRGETTGESGNSRDNEVPPVSLEIGEGFLNIDRSDHCSVLIDLLRQVPPLLSERPEDILFFFTRLGEIYSLVLVQDRVFITRIVPLLPRGLLQFLTGCLREQSDWATCKTRILQEYFP